MSPHPLNPVQSPETPRPDPADPLLNPRPSPDHGPQDLPPRQPGEVLPDADAPPVPGVPPSHPLGPPTPQPRN